MEADEKEKKKGMFARIESRDDALKTMIVQRGFSPLL